MIVICHNIRSSQNVGSIFRTAEAVGCVKIYLSGITPAPLDRFGLPNNHLLKASLGAEQYLAWEQVKSTKKLITDLKSQGTKILALEQALNSISLFGFDILPLRFLGRHCEESRVLEGRRGNLAQDKMEKSGMRVLDFALILGNEVSGLPLALLALADQIIEIPMLGRKESLNVAVAFGIVIFWLYGQSLKSSLTTGK